MTAENPANRFCIIGRLFLASGLVLPFGHMKRFRGVSFGHVRKRVRLQLGRGLKGPSFVCSHLTASQGRSFSGRDFGESGDLCRQQECYPGMLGGGNTLRHPSRLALSLGRLTKFLGL